MGLCILGNVRIHFACLKTKILYRVCVCMCVRMYLYVCVQVSWSVYFRVVRLHIDFFGVAHESLCV